MSLFASPVGPGSERGVQYAWNVGGSVVAGTDGDGKPIPLAGKLLAADGLSFYYFVGSFGGQDETATVTPSIGKQKEPSGSTTLTVFEPTATLTARPFAPFINNGSIEGAIDFKITNLMVPAGFQTDKTEFLQLVDSEDIRFLANGANHGTQLAGNGVDTSVPYPSDDGLVTNDHPGVQDPDPKVVHKGTWVRESYYKDDFTMYAMFKPSVANQTTIFVPLRYISWRYQAHAEWADTHTLVDPNTWIGVTSKGGKDVAATDYPNWSTNIALLQEKPGDPPPALPKPPPGGASYGQ